MRTKCFISWAITTISLVMLSNCSSADDTARVIKVEGSLSGTYFDLGSGKVSKTLDYRVILVTDCTRWKIRYEGKGASWEGIEYFEGFYDGTDTYLLNKHPKGKRSWLPGHGRGLEDVLEGCTIMNSNLFLGGQRAARIIWTVYCTDDYRVKEKIVPPILIPINHNYFPATNFSDTGDQLNALLSATFFGDSAFLSDSGIKRGQEGPPWLATAYQATTSTNLAGICVPTAFTLRFYTLINQDGRSVLSSEWSAKALTASEATLSELSYPRIGGRVAVGDYRFKATSVNTIDWNTSNTASVTYTWSRGTLPTRDTPGVLATITSLLKEKRSITIYEYGGTIRERLLMLSLIAGAILGGFLCLWRLRRSRVAIRSVYAEAKAASAGNRRR